MSENIASLLCIFYFKNIKFIDFGCIESRCRATPNNFKSGSAEAWVWLLSLYLSLYYNNLKILI